MAGKDKGHGSCYLCANSNNGNRYHRYVKRYSDREETDFKRAVPGGCRTVRRENKEPRNSTEI